MDMELCPCLPLSCFVDKKAVSRKSINLPTKFSFILNPNSTIVWLKDRLNSLERSIKHYRKRCGKLETRARGMTVDTPTRLSNTITLLRSPMPSASVAPVFWTKELATP